MIASAGLLLIELVALFGGVAFAVELAQRRLGADRLRVWMGGTPVPAALKGIAVGFITPFCTYSAVPLLIGLRRADVPPAGYVAFIVAAPVLDPILFGALVVIIGIKVAVVYLLVAFTAAMTLALIAQRIGISRYLKPLPSPPTPVPVTAAGPATPPSSLIESHGTIDQPWRGLRTESAEAADRVLGLFRSFGPLLVAGVGIGLAIEAFVSPQTATSVIGDNTAIAIPVAAALGTPLYFSTELFVPIADSLYGAGVGTGAIVALTIAGAGANIPEFVILSRLAQPRLITILFGYVFAVAAIGGLLAETIAT